MREEKNYTREETNFSSKLNYLLIGGGIGVILGLLLATKSGHELRRDIADVIRQGIEKAKEAAALSGERAGDYYEVTRKRASAFYQTAQEKTSQSTGKAKEASLGASPISAATEAETISYIEEMLCLGNKASALEGNPDIDFPEKIEEKKSKA